MLLLVAHKLTAPPINTGPQMLINSCHGKHVCGLKVNTVFTNMSKKQFYPLSKKDFKDWHRKVTGELVFYLSFFYLFFLFFLPFLDAVMWS